MRVELLWRRLKWQSQCLKQRNRDTAFKSMAPTAPPQSPYLLLLLPSTHTWTGRLLEWELSSRRPRVAGYIEPGQSDATPEVCFMWVLEGPAGGSGWGLLSVSSHSVQSPWLWGLSLSSSQPKITLPSTTWAESAAFPHSQQKWHCCVLLAFVIFWKCYQSPSYSYAFIFGALFQESFNVKRSFLQSTVFCFSILMLLTLHGHVCFVVGGEVKIHGKQFPKYGLAVYGLFHFFEGICVLCHVNHSRSTGVFMAFL